MSFALAAAALLLGASSALTGVCGPFTDVSDVGFCPFVVEIFTLGITTGTSPTTYDPASPVNRLQMAAFLSRTVDGVLKRGGRRAGLNRFWTTQNATVLGLTSLGSPPDFPKSDGADIWVTSFSGSVSRVRASDGKLLGTWTGAAGAGGVLVATGRILVTAEGTPGKLYMIDPAQPAGVVTTVASNLGNNPVGIAFDGARVWTANDSGSVSIVTPGPTVPWTVTTVTTGFTRPRGALYDGANVWIADLDAQTLLKLNPAGAILQTVSLPSTPTFPVFDGTNIWVPLAGFQAVSVVRASSGAVLKTLTGNGLTFPFTAAFDGERVLVTNLTGDTVSLWKAADLTPLGFFATGSDTMPFGACSDGVHFWITLSGASKLARF